MNPLMPLIQTPAFPEARCADGRVTPDPDIFNPDLDDPHKNEKTEAAKKICGSCVHKIECMVYALDKNESGVWGGTSERQRRRMRQRGYRTGDSYKGQG